MQTQETKRDDSKGQITIPDLAGKAHLITEDELAFLEEKPIVLSDKDRDTFLATLDRPARKPNAAMRKAMKKYKARYGGRS